MAATSSIVAAAMQLVAGLEGASGMPIAFLDRIEDPALFWARSAAILCDKTGDTFCDDQVQFMTANTEPLGMSRVIVYRDAAGATKRVCAVLPPVENPDPTMVAEAFGGGIPQSTQVPAYSATAAWLTIYHAAHCLDQSGTQDEEDRAAAFATLGLSFFQGDPVFTAGAHRAAGRKLAVMSGNQAAYWAAGVAERALTDVWKREAAAALRAQLGCNATVAANTSIDIESIRKDGRLPSGDDCSPVTDSTGMVIGAPRGTVTDSNLWIWMYGTGGIGAPPTQWSFTKLFNGYPELATYALRTAETLAAQR